MNNRTREIQRGDVFYADLSPVKGSEQDGTRPVLVIQNDVGNKYSTTVIIAPITSSIKKKGLPTHVQLPAHAGLPENSMVLLEQVRTIDKCRVDQYIMTSQFFNSPDHIIRRVDPLSEVKEDCTYCQVRKGYDYRIIRARKKLGSDRA